VRADAVEVDVCGLVDVEALREVDVDAEELGFTAGGAFGRGEGLRFEG